MSTTVGIKATASFTPAAAAYSAADVISVAQPIVFADGDGIGVPRGSVIRLMSCEVKIDQTAVQSGETSYSLALYSVTPPSAQADNAAWTLASADLPSYLGTLALGTPVDLGAACYVKTQFTDQQDYYVTSPILYGELITVGAATYTAVARQVILYGIIL